MKSNPAPHAVNILEVNDGFTVLDTADECQTAVMTLDPGDSSGPKSNEHPQSEQVLLVIEGEVVAEIGDKRSTLRRGDAIIVPRHADHRFTNEGKTKAVTFNVYTPPAYEKRS